MKKNAFFKLLMLLTIAFAFAACNNNSPEDRNIQLLTDSTSYNNNSLSDTATMMENTSADKRMTTSPQKSGNKSSSSKVDQTYTPSTNSASQGTTQKKGWSKAAQGAVIGGATGAVGGAIISKNKGAGAAVGAAVGAAGGYIIGRDKDKKDGRVKKKNQ